MLLMLFLSAFKANIKQPTIPTAQIHLTTRPPRAVTSPVSKDLKQKLQRLETQKRAALDGEDYAKAAEIKKAVEERTNEHTSFLQSDPL